MHGFVVGVYDSNYYELMIGGYYDNNGHMHIMEYPYVIITHFNNIVGLFGEEPFKFGEPFD